MRKLVLSMLFLPLCHAAQAQSFFEIGVKGGGGASMLFNNNILQDNRINKTPNLAYSYGAKLGFDFNENYAIIAEYMFLQMNQNNDFNNFASVNIKRNIQINMIQVPILFRYNNEMGGYVEIGPRLGLTKSVQESGTAAADVTSKFEQNTYGAVLGFGNVLFATDNIYTTIGLRIDAGMTDLISAAGGKNTPAVYPITNADFTTNYTNYAVTIPISVQLMLELNWDLGYFARSKCKKRSGFILF